MSDSETSVQSVLALERSSGTPAPNQEGLPELEHRLVGLCLVALERFNPEKVINGFALGLDLALAEAAIQLELPLVAAVPFVGQEKKWTHGQQAKYQELLTRATEIKVVKPGGYAFWKMNSRNEWMVNHSDLVLGLWNVAASGTGNCIESRGLKSSTSGTTGNAIRGFGLKTRNNRNQTRTCRARSRKGNSKQSRESMGIEEQHMKQDDEIKAVTGEVYDVQPNWSAVTLSNGKILTLTDEGILFEDTVFSDFASSHNAHFLSWSEVLTSLIKSDTLSAHDLAIVRNQACGGLAKASA
jgi:YspA SLOG family